MNAETTGATMYGIRIASEGANASLRTSLTRSAIGCSEPERPGPVRPVAELHPPEQLALEPRRVGEREQQEVDDQAPRSGRPTRSRPSCPPHLDAAGQRAARAPRRSARSRRGCVRDERARAASTEVPFERTTTSSPWPIPRRPRRRARARPRRPGAGTAARASARRRRPRRAAGSGAGGAAPSRDDLGRLERREVLDRAAGARQRRALADRAERDPAEQLRRDLLEDDERVGRELDAEARRELRDPGELVRARAA